MKFTKIAVIVFILILAIVAIYDVYLYEKNSVFPKTTKVAVDDTPRPVVNVENTKSNNSNVINDIMEETVLSLTSVDTNVVINARYQSVDKVNKTIEGVVYSYVLGITDNNNSLMKIWLTEDQYNMISNVVAVGNIDQGKPIKISVNPDSIIVENAF